MANILLTSVFRPFGIEDKYNKKGDEELLDYLAARLTREPGFFALSSYVPTCGTHLIAANIDENVRTLDWPSKQEFIEEIKKGYDYLGISFLIKGFRKMAQMIAITRKYSPKTKIVLGGFGTSLYEVDELDADYICRGEGIHFWRELLDKNVAEAPIRHPILTANINLKVFYNYFLQSQVHKIGLITNGFGCPNTCDFCATSAYYGGVHVPFMKTGQDLYKTMLTYHKSTRITDFLIFEEDLHLYQDHIKEFGALNYADLDHMFTYGCFSSVKSLSEFDIEELVAYGLGHVWIGVESANAPFQKREGRAIEDIFEELNSLGVTTTGSIIFGLDHHRPDNLEEEINFLSSLYPSTVQISTLMAVEGTELRTRLEDEGRIKKVGFKDADLFSEIISHPEFRDGEMAERVFASYDDVYGRIGPSLFRIMDTWFNGYKNLKKRSNRKLQKRGTVCGRQARAMVPFFLNTAEYLPNDDIRYKVKHLIDEVVFELGDVTDSEQGFATMLEQLFRLETTRQQIFPQKPIEPVPDIKNYYPQTTTS